MTGQSAPSRPPHRPSVQDRIARAWLEARQGDPAEAFRQARQLAREHNVPRHALPLLQTGLLLALRDHLNGQDAIAAEKLYRLMAQHPASRMPRQIFLAMLQESTAQHLGKTADATHRAEGRLVFGAGTGRSGSTTLCALLAAQPDTVWSHEHPPLIAWGRDGQEETEFHLARMRLLAQRHAVVADVAHWWLPKLPGILRAHPSARFVILRRERAATVESFMRVKGLRAPGGINHWMTHDGVRFRTSIWDICYPKFATEDPEEAIGRYWDRYYAMAEEAARARPEQVRIFEIDTLSDTDGQRSLLGFCGYEAPVVLPGIHRNRGAATDGKVYWHNPFGSVDVTSTGFRD